MTRARRPQTRPLTRRQSLFVAEYLVDLNAKQAAIRAGYAEGSAAEERARLVAEARDQVRGSSPRVTLKQQARMGRECARRSAPINRFG